MKELLEAESSTEAARLQEAWDLAGLPDQQVFPEPSEMDGIWNRLEAHVSDSAAGDTSQDSVREPQKSSIKARVVWLRWAAAAAVFLIGAIIYLLKPIELTVAPGKVARIMLDDGTRVELNSGATIRYARFFGNKRGVYLDGEAFFDVVKSTKPFIVQTHNADVTVLGTSFNVRAWSQDIARTTFVALQSGSVQLQNTKSGSEAVIMEPGQTASVSTEGVVLNEADTVKVNRAGAWREGDFFFSDEWVGSILGDVARRFDTEINVEASSILQKRLKLNLEKPASAEAVIAEICSGLQIRYREIAGGYELFDPN